MKNYLLLLKKYIQEKSNPLPIQYLRQISDSLSIGFESSDLKRIYHDNKANCFNIKDKNLILFYPPNDGSPTCPFEFYKDGSLIMDNQTAFFQISNLDEIIIQTIKLLDRTLDKNIAIDPYCLMLKLEDEIVPDYNGRANLVIDNDHINNENTNLYFVNRYLDHFIGWNFGLSVKSNDTIEQELNNLHQKAIDMAIREYAGTGFEVWNSDKVQDYTGYTGINQLRKTYFDKNNSTF